MKLKGKTLACFVAGALFATAINFSIPIIHSSANEDDIDFIIEDGVLVGYVGKASEITIPETVTSIGDRAFQNASFEKINIPNSILSIGNEAFVDCNNLSNVNLPSSLLSIGSGAFSNCYSLSHITIPANVITISDNNNYKNAFENCIELTGIDVETTNKSYKSIDGVLFSYDGTELIAYPCGKAISSYSVPSSTNSIKEYAFYCCNNLSNITLSNSVNTIGSHAFECCESLVSVNLPSNMSDIGTSAFENCTSLSSINIPTGINRIKERTFLDCQKLKTVNLPTGLLNISDKAFMGCSILTNPLLPESLLNIGAQAFEGCEAITALSMPNATAVIGEAAFAGCSSLRDLTISNNVGYIPPHLCNSCTSLTNIILPTNLEAIGNNAFENCSALNSIFIPDSLLIIADDAFKNHSSNLTLNVYADSVAYVYATENNIKYTIISRDYQITIPDYVTATRNGTELSDGDFIGTGEEIAITALVPDGYTLKSLSVNGTSFESGSIYTVGSSDVIIAVKFNSSGMESELDKLIENANENSILTIPLNKYGAILNENQIAEIKRKKLILYVTSDNYVWEVDSSDLPLSGTVDFTLKNPSGVISSNKFNVQFTGSIDFTVFNPFGASLIYKSGTKNAGKYANIFSVDNNKFKYQDSVLIGTDGGIEFIPLEKNIFIAINNSKITSLAYSSSNTDTTISLSGKIDLVGGNNSVTVELQNSNGKTIFSTVSSNGSYYIDNLIEGDYTLKISKSKYATRYFKLSLSNAPVLLNVKLRKYGDVTGDGIIDAKDATQILRNDVGLPSVFSMSDVNTKSYLETVGCVYGAIDNKSIISPNDATQILRYEIGLPSIIDNIK